MKRNLHYLVIQLGVMIGLFIKKMCWFVFSCLVYSAIFSNSVGLVSIYERRGEAYSLDFKIFVFLCFLKKSLKILFSDNNWTSVFRCNF